MLSEKLGWPRYYIGDIRRKKALEKGMTLSEYNKLGETDPSTDTEVDDYQKKLGEKEDNFIIEGRTSWHFIPHSFKIYLDANEKNAAERILNDLKKNLGRNEDKSLNTIKDVLKSLKERKKSDIKRYKKYYNINVYDKNNYDFTLNTTNLTIEDVFNETYKAIQGRLTKI
jgi:cytidylate kinase